VQHYSLSNRTADERISFTLEKEAEEYDGDTQDQISSNLEIEEMKNQQMYKTQGNEADHILIKEVNDLSFNLYDDSKQNESHMSKAYNSCFANSSNTTKKKIYVNKDQVNSVASPVVKGKGITRLLIEPHMLLYEINYQV
jgi:hypothetical protein